MKTSQMLMVIAAFVVLLILSVFSFRSAESNRLAHATGDGANTTNYSTSMTVISGTQWAEEVPPYPNAEQPKVIRDWPVSVIREIDYQTSDTIDDVLSFYKKALEKSGWTISAENNRAYGRYLEFIWTDVKQLEPYRLKFNALVENAERGNTSAPSSPTYVSTQIERLPRADKVPLYPSAEQQAVDYTTTEYGTPEKISKFETSAAEGDIEQYYRSVLPEYGWKLGGYSANGRLIGDKSIRDGLIFTYASGGPEASYSGAVTILVQTKPNGKVEVEIRASGNDISSR